MKTANREPIASNNGYPWMVLLFDTPNGEAVKFKFGSVFTDSKYFVDKAKMRTSMIRYNKAGEPYFMTHNQRIYLNTCLRTGWGG